MHVSVIKKAPFQEKQRRACHVFQTGKRLQLILVSSAFNQLELKRTCSETSLS